MTEDVPAYSGITKYEIDIADLAAFDEIVNGPTFSFIPTDYVFTVEAAQSTSWIDVASDRVNE